MGSQLPSEYFKWIPFRSESSYSTAGSKLTQGAQPNAAFLPPSCSKNPSSLFSSFVVVGREDAFIKSASCVQLIPSRHVQMLKVLVAHFEKLVITDHYRLYVSVRVHMANLKKELRATSSEP